MLVIRRTAKLLARLGPATPTGAFSTTRLGDFYAQPLAWRAGISSARVLAEKALPLS